MDNWLPKLLPRYMSLSEGSTRRKAKVHPQIPQSCLKYSGILRELMSLREESIEYRQTMLAAALRTAELG